MRQGLPMDCQRSLQWQMTAPRERVMVAGRHPAQHANQKRRFHE